MERSAGSNRQDRGLGPGGPAGGLTGHGRIRRLRRDLGVKPKLAMRVLGASTISVPVLLLLAVLAPGAGAVAFPRQGRAPTVTGVSPSTGPAAGGTLVTVSGRGFTGAIAVDFGGAAAASFSVVSDSQLTAVSPAGKPGTVDATVTTDGGTSVASPADQFGYLAQADHWGKFFGDNILADSGRTPRPARVTIPDASPIVQVATSNSTQYALLADGTLWAWGQGTYGQLGNGGNANSFTAPVQVVFPSGVSIAAIPVDAMPFDTALAVDSQGNAWGWGLNKKGELCLGNTLPYTTPVQLPLTDVTALAGANEHAVYDTGGTVKSCGTNDEGVLGTGGTASSTHPVRVTGLPAGVAVTALVSAYHNAGALLANGQFYDWGHNAAGQLGDGSTQSSAVPVLVSFPDSSPVTQVAEGGSSALNGQTIVMLADGTTWAWGNDSWGQLGDGGSGFQPSPVQFFPPSGVTYATLASGGATSYAIDTSGNVWAWGNGTSCQLGTGTKQSSPVPVNPDTGAALISSTAADVVVAP
jgi:alpha-tubulin suppressor-like RCC1 family protein